MFVLLSSILLFRVNNDFNDYLVMIFNTRISLKYYIVDNTQLSVFQSEISQF